jgi:hypothetical protein
MPSQLKTFTLTFKGYDVHTNELAKKKCMEHMGIDYKELCNEYYPQHNFNTTTTMARKVLKALETQDKKTYEGFLKFYNENVIIRDRDEKLFNRGPRNKKVLAKAIEIDDYEDSDDETISMLSQDQYDQTEMELEREEDYVIEMNFHRRRIYDREILLLDPLDVNYIDKVATLRRNLGF